jgi:3-dehydroquinate dehydratase I
MNTSVLSIGSVTVGDRARVVGIISKRESVPRLMQTPRPACDLVEVRLDRMDVEQDNWPQDIEKIERHGFPVIATLRVATEGGTWDKQETLRRPHFMRALTCASCLDIEYRSALFEELADETRDAGKTMIASYHDYAKTPSLDELRSVITHTATYPNVVCKIAVRIQSEDDIARLQCLLEEPRPAPLCLIGMGDLGVNTRVEFPRLGSCLAYGHLDGSTAPGQLSCEALASALRG